MDKRLFHSSLHQKQIIVIIPWHDDQIDGSRMQIAQQITFFLPFFYTTRGRRLLNEDDVDENCWKIACLTLKNELYFILKYLRCLLCKNLCCVPGFVLFIHLILSFQGKMKRKKLETRRSRRISVI